MDSPKPHHVSYYDRNMNKRTIEVKRKQPVQQAIPKERIPRSDVVFLCYLVLFFSAGLFAGSHIKPKPTCTTTITDMQGTQHVLKGKAD